MKAKNPVARFGHKYNKALIFKDRKQEAKRGMRKHKKAPVDGAFCCLGWGFRSANGWPLGR